MIKGNKGEWSEYYAFLKLLVNRRLDFGGPGYKKLDQGFYSIIKLIRIENNISKSYELLADGRVKVSDGNKDIRIVDIADVKEKIESIFKIIAADSERTFSIGDARKIMNNLGNSLLSAGSQMKDDLTLKIHDEITGSEPEIGFSIKSMIGSPATLLNASGATNFIYTIKGIDESKVAGINRINTRAKIRDRLVAIEKVGGFFEYKEMDSKIFEGNLRLCDTILPEILAQMLLLYNMGRGNSLEGLIDQVVMCGVKIRGFSIDRLGYEHKISNLLYAVALGMVPNSKWNGFMRAYGGYIIVRDDGELVGYNVYNADIFRKYLLKTTKFETASSSRHEFGVIYESEGKFYIKLNLQIRFLN